MRLAIDNYASTGTLYMIDLHGANVVLGSQCTAQLGGIAMNFKKLNVQ